MNIDPALLWVLGTLVSILILLVGALFTMVRSEQKTSNARQETNRIEVSEALKIASAGHESLRKELTQALESAKKDAAETHREQWAEINKLKDNRLLCQKHEDSINGSEKDIKEIEESMYKWKTQLADLKYAQERYQRETDNSLQVFASIVKDQKK